MPVVLKSGSEAVKRTLAELVRAAGGETAKEGELTIEDKANPVNGAADGAVLAVGETPLRPNALVHQLKARLGSAAQALPLAHGWQLAMSARQLTRDGSSALPLTEKEALLMQALARANPQPVKRETLLRDIWAYEGDIETHTLETHIYRLRQKLEEAQPRPCDIVTLDGAYRLVVE